MKNKYGYQFSDEEDDDASLLDDKKEKENDLSEYSFEGYEVEINAKVVLLPKINGKP